jgi:hypothetical protein
MVRRAGWFALALGLGLSVSLDFVLPGAGDGPRWLHRGFFSWFGFAGCVLIIVGSKLLGRWWLDRPEDYYDRETDDA